MGRGVSRAERLFKGFFFYFSSRVKKKGGDFATFKVFLLKTSSVKVESPWRNEHVENACSANAVIMTARV